MLPFVSTTIYLVAPEFIVKPVTDNAVVVVLPVALTPKTFTPVYDETSITLFVVTFVPSWMVNAPNVEFVTISG